MLSILTTRFLNADLAYESWYQQRLCLETWHIDSAHAPLNRDEFKSVFTHVTNDHVFHPKQKKMFA